MSSPRIQEHAVPVAPQFNRWFIPVGVVAVHICIGSVYALLGVFLRLSGSPEYLSDFLCRARDLVPSDPWLCGPGSWLILEAALFVIFTMYGGGFATIPAFLADIFGLDNVGAIHGALLTAWSAAAVVGPVIITELSKQAKAGLAPGASKIHIYDTPLEVLAAMLAVGFVLTLLVRPLHHAKNYS